MSFGHIIRYGFACSAIGLALVAAPAEARRTVIDQGFSLPTDGNYCSPSAASGAGCTATSLPFGITIGGQTYNSVYVNSNGTVSFVSIESQLASQNSFVGGFPVPTYTGPAPADSLGDYSAPIFSPNFVDGPGFFNTSPSGYDGQFASTQALTANSLTVNFFTCVTTIACGYYTIEKIANAQFATAEIGLKNYLISFFSSTPSEFTEASFESGQANYLARASFDIFTIRLSDLADGFSVEYLYSPSALGDVGTSGFNIAGGLTETTGPLTNRTFFFDSDGQLLTAAVPEPATWLSMLFGFGMIGASMRRRRQLASAKLS